MRLNTRQLRRLLWVLCGLLALALIALAVALPLAPLASFDASDRRRTSLASGPATRPASARALGDYAVLWQRRLRPPLFDPPPAPVKPVEVVKPKLTARLIGTVIDEPDNSYGIFAVPGVGTKMIKPGEKVAEATVLHISEDSAEVEFAGEKMTLKVEKNP